jgi:hypothetical protein
MFTGLVFMIFNDSFLQAYYILDEILIAGELQESSKKNVARLIAAQVQFLTIANLNSVFFLFPWLWKSIWFGW